MSGFFSKLKVPHVFTLLTGVILVCSLLTYIVPSGAFERQKKEINGTMRTLVVSGTYQELPKHISPTGMLLGEKVEGKATPVSLLDFVSAVPRGMEGAAYIIFFIFVVGGAFGILQRTGVISATVHKLLHIFKDYSALLTIVIMLTLSIGGSTLGMGEEFIPLVPIFLLVSKQLGFDRLYGLALVILSAQVGFAAATTNPFTLVVAQGIAEVQPISGWPLRVALYSVCITLSIGYVLWYGRRIRKDPSLSLMDGDPFELEDDQHKVAFTGAHAAILISCLFIFAVVLVGSARWHWSFSQIAGGFFLMGLVAAAIARLPIDEAANAFVKGLEEMVVAALVVGFAKGIEVVLTDGQVLDTVIQAAAGALQEVPRIIAVQGMFVFQSCLNFLIPSGSGQATVTMPLMAPLADILGITRQTAVLAFQCGDGFTNMIIPTSGILMAMLSIARIPYNKWVRFVLPLLGMMVITAMTFLTIAVLIDYQ